MQSRSGPENSYRLSDQSCVLETRNRAGDSIELKSPLFFNLIDYPSSTRQFVSFHNLHITNERRLSNALDYSFLSLPSFFVFRRQVSPLFRESRSRAWIIGASLLVKFIALSSFQKRASVTLRFTKIGTESFDTRASNERVRESESERERARQEERRQKL